MTVEQAAQRLPGEVILPDDFEVTVNLDGDGTMDTVYLSYVSSMPPGACGISEADCEYNQRDVGNPSLMILDTSIGRTPAVLGCGLVGVAVAAGPYGVRSLYCNENELRWNLGEYV